MVDRLGAIVHSLGMTVTNWRTRGYLPHRDEEHLAQHVVLNLADALPRRYDGPDDLRTRLVWIDRELDAGHGRRLLAVPENAAIVEASILHHHGTRYALSAWCVMPTHVHIVVETFRSQPLSSIVQAWKSVAAHAINKREGRNGPLWQREYFDRFMRNQAHYQATVAYVENNPVAAGLVENPWDWRFSSAWRGHDASNAGEGAGAPA